ncbi:hypothetical protein ASD83_17790 [Devosia sp. Root685]|uniref:hypothetical protein n=1 Tax=Devosia sp. Root685 TaxID=1736587 RepID=UPI0006F64DAD|nr:hypothetical protein [Devosia sp. Root685]KRA95514.1 hypothetical protein ASD83_17790 [Devosia sp. Root685]
MRSLGLFALALSLLPLNVAAAPAAKTKSLADCAALVASISDIVTGPNSAVEDIDGGCRATNISYGVSSFMSYSVDEVTLRSPDLLANFPAGDIFEAAELDLKGVRFKPLTHSPLQDYILALNTVGMDLRLAYTTDPEALTSQAEFEFSAERLGRFAIKASLSNFDNTDVDINDITEVSGTLNQLDFTLEDRGLFAAIFAPAVLNMLFPPDEDPTGAIMVMQETVVATLAGLPEGTLSPGSLVALGTLIRAFPKPEGDWHLNFVSERGISLDDLNADNPAAIAAILADAKITATGGPAQ